MDIIVYISLALFGAIFGSFAGATVWRIRSRQLAYDKKHGEPVDNLEYKKLSKLNKKPFVKDRSQCLHCGYELKWYDLIPVLSWISLGGRCRSCKKPIGYFELLMELGVAAAFVAVYAFWPGGVSDAWDVAGLVVWLASIVVMSIMFAYDVKWLLLPDMTSALLAVLGVSSVVLTILAGANASDTVLSAVASVGILSGLYLVLYVVSGGQWVGFGDVKLGVGLGLMLADCKLALLALFLANFIGVLAVLPSLLTKKLNSKSHVPFGPLLISGTFLAWLVGRYIIDWYLLML